MNKRNRVIFCVFMLMGMLSSAQAFTLVNSSNQKGWSGSEVVFEVDYTNCPVSVDELNSAIDSAIELWNGVPSSSLHISRVTASDSIDPAEIFIRQTPGNPRILCDRDFSTSSGFDADRVVGFGRLFSSTDGVPGFGYVFLNAELNKEGNIAKKSALKLKVILAHEMGHVLGLGHSADSAALMYFNATEKTELSLAPDDVSGINYLYPRQELLPMPGLACGTLDSNSSSGGAKRGSDELPIRGALEWVLWLGICQWIIRYFRQSGPVRV